MGVAMDTFNPTASAGSARFIQTITDGDATDGVLLGTLGAGTAITLLTMAHALFSGGKRRKKRSTDTEHHGAYTVYASDNELEAPGLDAVYASDTNWCGLRLTCELAAKAGRVLDEEERIMLSFFRGAISAEDLQTMPSPQLYYAYASFVGFSSGDRAKCMKMYDKCTYDSNKMMEVYKMAAKQHSSRKIKPDL